MRDFREDRIELKLSSDGTIIYGRYPCQPQFLMMEPADNFENDECEKTLIAHSAHATRMFNSSMQVRTELIAYHLPDGMRVNTAYFNFSSTPRVQADGLFDIKMNFRRTEAWVLEPNPNGSTQQQIEGIKTQRCLAFVDLAVLDTVVDWAPANMNKGKDTFFLKASA